MKITLFITLFINAFCCFTVIAKALNRLPDFINQSSLWFYTVPNVIGLLLAINLAWLRTDALPMGMVYLTVLIAAYLLFDAIKSRTNEPVPIQSVERNTIKTDKKTILLRCVFTLTLGYLLWRGL